MKAVVEPLEGNKVKLSVEVDEQEFEQAIDAAFRRMAREVRVPGFRPGKAPRRVLEARIGADVARQEALRESLPDFYAQAVAEHEVQPIAPPSIDITAGEEAGPVAFDAVVEVMPQVTVPGYDSLRVSVPSIDATDEEVSSQLERLRQQHGELQSVSRPAKDGDHVTVDLKGYRHDQPVEGLNAEDFMYEVGTGTVLPQLDDELRGAKVGDILKFNATVGDGEEATIQILVKDVKEKLLPDVTDEWASEASEFETVAELEGDIRNRIALIKKFQAQMAIRNNVVDALVELVADDMPEPLIGAEMERRLHTLAHRLSQQQISMGQYLEGTGTTQEQLIEELRTEAASAVKADLALRAVAEAEAITITEEDLDDEVVRMAERMGEKPDKVRSQLDRADQMPAVRSELRNSKALEWLVEHAEIVDEEGNPIDRADLAPDTSEEEVQEES
ncbi:MAG TPA: trigger factor [Acidimicrobiales bacterium]|nr:trigger factor [Acidimicrobiales bacterium]